MQNVAVIGCHSAADGPQHEVTAEKKEEIAKCNSQARPLS